MRMMKTDAVFEGGGVRAIAFAGAVCCFEDHGYKWQRIAGTSAGSIVAALLAVGYTGRELKEIIEDVDYRKFMDRTGSSRCHWWEAFWALSYIKAYIAGIAWNSG